MDPLSDLSVIIPFLGSDKTWKDLLRDLKHLPAEAEILLVGPDAPDEEIFKKSSVDIIAQIRYVPSERGRGVQLNNGVRASHKNFFWFLHADSKVPRGAIHALKMALIENPQALHYFELHFLPDGPRLVHLNSMVANLRSKYLTMPFGDQGFAIRRTEFYRIGGFPEHVRYGEDHVFVWEARRKKISVIRIDSPIFTSARRYEDEGWGRLTRKRIYLTAKQATSECLRLLKHRVVESLDKS